MDKTIAPNKPRGEWLIGTIYLGTLALCVATPWILWAAGSALSAILGVILAQFLYAIFLKPGGICFGIGWIFVALSGFFAFLAIVIHFVLR